MLTALVLGGCVGWSVLRLYTAQGFWSALIASDPGVVCAALAVIALDLAALMGVLRARRWGRWLVFGLSLHGLLAEASREYFQPGDAILLAAALRGLLLVVALSLPPPAAERRIDWPRDPVHMALVWAPCLVLAATQVPHADEPALRFSLLGAALALAGAAWVARRFHQRWLVWMVAIALPQLGLWVSTALAHEGSLVQAIYCVVLACAGFGPALAATWATDAQGPAPGTAGRPLVAAAAFAWGLAVFWLGWAALSNPPPPSRSIFFDRGAVIGDVQRCDDTILTGDIAWRICHRAPRSAVLVRFDLRAGRGEVVHRMPDGGWDIDAFATHPSGEVALVIAAGGQSHILHGDARGATTQVGALSGSNRARAIAWIDGRLEVVATSYGDPGIEVQRRLDGGWARRTVAHSGLDAQSLRATHADARGWSFLHVTTDPRPKAGPHAFTLSLRSAREGEAATTEVLRLDVTRNERSAQPPDVMVEPQGEWLIGAAAVGLWRREGAWERIRLPAEDSSLRFDRVSAPDGLHWVPRASTTYFDVHYAGNRWIRLTRWEDVVVTEGHRKLVIARAPSLGRARLLPAVHGYWLLSDQGESVRLGPDLARQAPPPFSDRLGRLLTLPTKERLSDHLPAAVLMSAAPLLLLLFPPRTVAARRCAARPSSDLGRPGVRGVPRAGGHDGVALRPTPALLLMPGSYRHALASTMPQAMNRIGWLPTNAVRGSSCQVMPSVLR